MGHITSPSRGRVACGIVEAVRFPHPLGFHVECHYNSDLPISWQSVSLLSTSTVASVSSSSMTGRSGKASKEVLVSSFWVKYILRCALTRFHVLQVPLVMNFPTMLRLQSGCLAGSGIFNALIHCSCKSCFCCSLYVVAQVHPVIVVHQWAGSWALLLAALRGSHVLMLGLLLYASRAFCFCLSHWLHYLPAGIIPVSISALCLSKGCDSRIVYVDVGPFDFYVAVLMSGAC